MSGNDGLDSGVDQLTQNTKDLHYTTVQNALEDYYDVEIEGSLTRAEYPSEDAEKGYVRFFFTGVDTDE